MASRIKTKEIYRYTISAGVVTQIVRYLSQWNVDSEQLLNSIGIASEVVKNPDERIPVEKYIMLEDMAAKKLGDPCFGLHMGQYAEAGNWSILGYMMLNCDNIIEAFNKASRYSAIIGNLIKGEISIESNQIRIQLTEPLDAPKISEHCYEGFLSSLINIARNITGVYVSPLEVGLKSLKREFIEEYKKTFGESVKFTDLGNYMILDNKTAYIPALLPNKKLAEYFENYAQQFLAEIDRSKYYTLKTKKLILSLIDSESLSIGTIAKILNLSERTLQIYLHKEGTEFSILLRDTREQLARKYLMENYSIDDITYLLGFSDASVFRKAFKKWVGLTPGEYRDRITRGIA